MGIHTREGANESSGCRILTTNDDKRISIELIRCLYTSSLSAIFSITYSLASSIARRSSTSRVL